MVYYNYSTTTHHHNDHTPSTIILMYSVTPFVKTHYSGTPLIQTPWDLDVFLRNSVPDLQVKHHIHVFVKVGEIQTDILL